MNEHDHVAADDHRTVHTSDPADTLPRCPTCGLQVPGLSSCPNDGTNLFVNPLNQSSLGGRYEFLEPIGQGGMSVIFKARQPLLKRIVAIKLMQSHLDANPQTKMRFEKEGEALSSLSHPNIVAVFDCGFAEQARPFLVMAYVEGRSLSRVLKEEGELALPRALNIFSQICAGLEHAHKRGVLHRDLKPSNIMITGEGAEEKAIIVDFGVAKILDDTTEGREHLTATGETLGSPPYMSPEQCQGIRVDERSDIYSLGCLMYECITGELPLLGRNALETMHKQINEEPAPIRTIIGPVGLKPHVQAVLDKTLAKQPFTRYRNAGDILFDVELLRSAVDRGTVPKLSALKAASGQRLSTPMLAISIAAALAIGNLSFWVLWKDPFSSKVPSVQAEVAGDDGVSGLLSRQPEVAEVVATSVGAAGLGALASLQNLHRLTLKEVNSDDRSLVALAKLSHVEELSITDQRITDRALSFVAKMPALKKLTLEAEHITERGLNALSESGVEELVLHNANVSSAGFGKLATLPHLVQLSVQATSVHEIGDEAVDVITKSLPALTTLKLESTQISNAVLKKLERLKQLRRLSLSFSKGLSDEGMPAVARLSHLQSLNLSGVDVTDDGLQVLSQMVGLQELYLWRARISDKAAASISKMKDLKVLHLSNTEITDQGLALIARMRSLRDLKLKETKITDRGLAHLKESPRLSKLSLQKVSLTDKGVATIGELANLEDLDLSETIVSDKGLQALGQMTKLRHLYLKDCTHITAVGVSGLQQSIPSCVIDPKHTMPSSALQ